MQNNDDTQNRNERGRPSEHIDQAGEHASEAARHAREAALSAGRAADSAARVAAEGAAGTVRGAASGTAGAARSAASGTADAARTAASGTAQAARGAAQGAAKAARAAASGTASAAGRVAGGTADIASDTGASISEATRRVADAVGGWWDSATGSQDRLPDSEIDLCRSRAETYPAADLTVDVAVTAYALGYIAASNPGYEGQPFTGVESDLRHGYANQSCGYDAWRDFTRYGYESGTRP